MNLLLKNKTKILNALFYFTLVTIIIIGIWVRTKYYLSGVPYWLDEILLASNIANMSISDILAPLGAYQKTPPLFVTDVLICKMLFGMAELSLRLIPYICGVCSLIMFYTLCKKNINNKAGILAGVYAFAFCVPLIYMSGELKQYGSDALITILLILSYEYININHMDWKKTVLYSIGCIAIILYSFPTLFTIPALILSKIITERKFNIKIIFIAISIIAAGLFLCLYDKSNYDFMINYWNTENGFKLKFLLLYIPDACKYFIYNFNTAFVTCILMFFTGGLYVLFKEKKELFTFFMITFIFAIITATTYIYPLKPKLCIYLLPIFIFIIAKSFDALTIIKNINIKLILNLTLFAAFIFVYGINIPYINMSDEELTYYNRASLGRNKSIDDRNTVKSYSKILLKDTTKSDIILASEEFLFSAQVYQKYFKYSNLPNIKTYKEVEREKLTKYAEEFIKENLHNSNAIWLAGRDDEYFFKCANSIDIERIIERLNLKYKTFNNNDIYLIRISKES